MAMSLGTKGYNGVSLVRDTKKFKQNFDDIDFSKAPQRMPVRMRGGKKTYAYGKAGVKE